MKVEVAKILWLHLTNNFALAHGKLNTSKAAERGVQVVGVGVEAVKVVTAPVEAGIEK